MSDRDDDGRAYQSGNRTPTDVRVARIVRPTNPSGYPAMQVDDAGHVLVIEPERPRKDTDEQIAAAVADARAEATIEHRLSALEASHTWFRRGLVAIGAAAIGSLGGVVAKIWAVGETATTERVELRRALEDIRDIREEQRLLRRSSELQPDRAHWPVTNASRTP